MDKCDCCQKQQDYGAANPAGNETCYRDDYDLERYTRVSTEFILL